WQARGSGEEPELPRHLGHLLALARRRGRRLHGRRDRHALLRQGRARAGDPRGPRLPGLPLHRRGRVRRRRLMRAYFEELANHLDTLAAGGEVIISRFAAEQSDFIRFNRSAVRQATAVSQATWSVSLIRGMKRIDASTSVAGDAATDREALARLVK